MNNMKSFKDLELYKKSYDLSLEIHKISLNFPNIESYVMGDKIRRCSKSICSNLAKGHGKEFHSKARFKRYIQICISYLEVAKMLQGFYKVWR
jgi:four helix bundle protein